MFTLKEKDLLTLWKTNQFDVPSDRWVFFGLRGCLPVNDEDFGFSEAHMLQVASTDHIHPRCTLGQWAPGKGFAVFPGSTVPHRKYVEKSLIQGGKGANQLLTGCYKDYRKGIHLKGKKTGHEAFRQDNRLPVRRTADDMDYDEDDRVEYGLPFDNLHAGWCQGVNHDNYASAGCQVVVGFPCCEKRDNLSDTGPWKVFKENVYTIPQKSFYYVLLTGRDTQRVVAAGGNLSPRLRFGSTGNLVTIVQKRLRTLGYYEGNIDEDFGPRMLRALLEFQTKAFGPKEDDGIVGPQTASALEIRWPDSSKEALTTAGAIEATEATAGGFRIEGRNAVSPEGTCFARKYKKGVFNNGRTSIGKFVRGHQSVFEGVSDSLLNVMESVSKNEGKLEAINTWDDSFLTFGIFQWTAGTGNGKGELPALLGRLKQQQPFVFATYFGKFGLDITGITGGASGRPGVKPAGFFLLDGEKLDTPSKKEKLRTLEWAYRMWAAGNDDIVRETEIRQAMDRIRIFYRSRRHLIDNRFIADYITSEYGVALLLDQHVNRPGHVLKTLRKAVGNMSGPKDPSMWASDDERELIDLYVDLRSGTTMTNSDERAQRVADALVDGVISDKRGSFVV